jgi:hypothetical protein
LSTNTKSNEWTELDNIADTPSVDSGGESLPLNDIGKLPGDTHSELTLKGGWILLCLQYNKYVCKAIHVPVSDITADEDLFCSFRENYYKEKSKLTQFVSWKAVTNIHFVEVPKH